MSKLSHIAMRIAAVVCGVTSIVALVAFIMAAFWNGFRVYFPAFTLSVTEPWRPLLLSLVFCCLYEVFARMASLGDSGDMTQKHDVAPSCHAFWIVGVAIVMAVRFAYRSYIPALMGKTPDMAVTILAPFMLAGAALGAWRTSRCAQESPASSHVGWFPVLLWVLVPIVFPLHPLSTIAFWLAALVQPAANGVRVFKERPGIVWIGVGVLTLISMIVLGSIGPGWAGKRAISTLSDYYSISWWLIVVAGVLIAIFAPGKLRGAIHQAGWLALFGFALAGTRGVWGMAGAVLVIPALSMLLLAIVTTLDRHLASYRFSRNLVQLCLAGFVFWFIGANLWRDVFFSALTN
jgi:hypothetical protein